MDSRFPRTLVESLRFTGERERIAPNVRRFDEAMRAIDFRLCRDPESGIHIDRGLWATCISFPGGPTLAIYYTFDDHTVELQSLRIDPLFSEW